MSRAQQLALDLHMPSGWGGRRPRAGRKAAPDAHILRRCRGGFGARQACHVTVKPDQLGLEITESTALERSHANLKTIRSVRELGVHVVLDDLGTGYSSLNALRQLPMDGVKIDRSFVAGVATDPVVATITSGLISIAHGLGIDVTAEGVETWEQMAFLHSRGCHRMQGYLFGKPLGSDEFARHAASGEVPWDWELPESDSA